MTIADEWDAKPLINQGTQLGQSVSKLCADA